MSTTLPPPSQVTTDPVAVLGRNYCVPYVLDLTVSEKLCTLARGDFTVKDIKKDEVMKSKGKLFSLADRRVLCDAAGNPIITMKAKIMTLHRRWLVYKGDSTKPEDLLFVVETSSVSMFQTGTSLRVFLAVNTSEKTCDFMVKGKNSEMSCVIYEGANNQNIIGRMNRKNKVKTMCGKDTYDVTVYPNVDFAFIITLVIISDAINTGISLKKAINFFMQITSGLPLPC